MAASADIALKHCSCGRVASRTESEDHTLTFAYDALDRLARIGYPDGSAQTTTYDKLDVAHRTDLSGPHHHLHPRRRA